MLISRSTTFVFVLAAILLFGSAPAQAQTDCNGNGIDDACDLSCGPAGGPCDVPGCGTSVDCNSNGVPDECDLRSGDGSGFAKACAWTTFDTLANNPPGAMGWYEGAAFDGRYLYFPTKAQAPGVEILRLDTDADFHDPAAWTPFDAGAPPLGARGGYTDAVFDGRYVYCVPANRTAFHGEVLRYDPSLPFTMPTSWEKFDYGDNCGGACNDPDGFTGGVFDGRFVYFVPTFNGTQDSGEVMRFDTTGVFTNPASWQTFDAPANGVPGDPRGYAGGTFDGRYIYFAPVVRDSGSTPHELVLRYDTISPFGQSTSWATFDASGICAPDCTAGVAYNGAVFDGRYVYFVPHSTAPVPNSAAPVLRYDTAAAFNDAAGWAAYDVLINSPFAFGLYERATFDGRYIYFSPSSGGPIAHGEALRYDTQGSFFAATSWSVYDYGADPLGCAADTNCHDPDGFHGAIFTGRYVYFVASYNGTAGSGEFMRYDTLAGSANDCNCDAIPDVCDIANCPPGDPSCQDCNGNGIPDGCDTDTDGDGVPDDCDQCPFDPTNTKVDGQCIPTLSDWGMMAMAALLLSAGGVVIARRRAGRGRTSYE